jgi:hypothetical protein
MKSFTASWKSSQKDKKAQKNKRKCRVNDTSKSEQNYSRSFKLVALKPKRAKIGIPTKKYWRNNSKWQQTAFAYSYRYS